MKLYDSEMDKPIWKVVCYASAPILIPVVVVVLIYFGIKGIFEFDTGKRG